MGMTSLEQERASVEDASLIPDFVQQDPEERASKLVEDNAERGH